MKWIITFLSSSIGRKLIMSLTGLFLIQFLLVHLIGNLQLLIPDGGVTFNSYAAFMTGNPIIKFISYGLYFFIILHAVQGLIIYFGNKKAKSVKTSISTNANSTWASKNMALLGILILAFLLIHMGDFWLKMKTGNINTVQVAGEKHTVRIDGQDHTVMIGNQEHKVMIDGQEHTVMIEGKEHTVRVGDQEHTVMIGGKEHGIADLYSRVNVAFDQWWIVLFYILGMIALGFHLHHGFQSAFQTLGIRHKKYTPIINTLGVGFAIIIPFAYAMIPIIMYFT